MFNPYQNFEGEIVHWINHGGEFSGEYEVSQKLLDPWFFTTLGTKATSQDLEIVSFPFWPDRNATDMDNSSNRILTVLSDEEFLNQFLDPNGNGHRTLASVTFGEIEGDFANTVIPHTIYRHSFNLHCGENKSSPISENITWTVDLTRGPMREYPFNPQNGVDLKTKEYDVIYYPFFLLNNNYLAISNDDISEMMICQGGPATHLLVDVCDIINCSTNTINYFPNDEIDPNFCADSGFNFANLYPTIINGTNSPCNFIYPSPFSLSGFFMQGERGAHPVGYQPTPSGDTLEKMTGIPHTYIIDENININLINPDEKIIYNPSEVHIEATDLVFPSGYTFKTVRGLYPTVDEVNAQRDSSTLCGMLNFGPDDRDIPIPTDLDRSEYILEDGSHLTIQPCVKIFDADFLVKDGATLEYDPNQTFGNFNITTEPLGTVIDVTMPNTQACNDCQCMQKYDHEEEFNDDNELIIENETIVWTEDKRIRGQIVVKNGGTLFINGAVVEFADSERIGIPTGITVEAGGKLEVFSSLLTTLSGKFCAHEVWDGIRLHGVGDGAKDYSAELEIDLSTIDNARVAITAQGATYTDLNGETYESGGIVTAKNTRFLNNYISFHASSFNPASEFLSCIFAQTQLLNDEALSSNGAMFAHAVFFDMDSIKFKSCHFSNQISEQFDYEDRGIGIFSINTPVHIGLLEPTDQVINPINQTSVFQNFYKGIDHYGFLMNSALEVEDTHFDLVLRGITTNSSHLDQITNCNFQMGTDLGETRDNTVSPPITAYGIYAYAAQDYQFETNDFEIKMPSNFEAASFYYTGSFNAYGIISNNSADGGGRIYDNDFGILDLNSLWKQLNVGNQTEENNRFLEILCNEYNTKVNRGWYVNPEQGNPQILDQLANQGTGCFENNSILNPAGNLFYNFCENSGVLFENIDVGFLDPIQFSQSNGKMTYWGTGGFGPSNPSFPCAPFDFVDVKGGCSSNNRSAYCEEADLEPVVQVWMDNNTPFGVAGLIEGGNYTPLEQSQLTLTALSIYEQKGEKNNAMALVNALSSDHALDLSMKYHLSLEETGLAQNKLNEMAVRNVYDSEYIGFYQLLINVKTSNRHYHELTAIEVQSVENVANSYSYAAVNAQALLAMLNEVPYDRVPMLGTNHSQKKETVSDDNIQLYPNPIEDSFTIHIPQNNTHLLVYDIRGILLKTMVVHQGKQTLDLDLPNGTYFLSLEDDTSIQTKKILIAH